MKKVFAVYGEESGWMKDFETKKECADFIKGVKVFDKEHGIEDTYYIQEDFRKDTFDEYLEKKYKIASEDLTEEDYDILYAEYKKVVGIEEVL